MITIHQNREKITVSNVSKALTYGTYLKNTTIYADVQVQAYQVRVTFDGSTAPVAATTGELWNPGDRRRIWGAANITNIRFIRESSDATLEVNYFGEAA